MIGDITIEKILLNDESYELLNNRYIAIDVETTGLDPLNNVIIDIGLVLYEKGHKINTYQSLIHINEVIPKEIEELTGINNNMLINAPSEKQVYKEVVEYLADALDGKTYMVAHNATFDLTFLQKALIRYGYFGTLKYVDTLNISRSLIKGLFNYKQDSVATYFNIINERAHRALPDAVVCGEILSNLLKIYKSHDQTLDISTSFDNLFELKVKQRGIIYYRFNMIKDYKEIENGCICNITGAELYNVGIEIKGNKFNGVCNCPYYLDNHANCKHIYALLLKYQSFDKLDK